MDAVEKRNTEEMEHMQKLIFNTKQEPYICKHFGCGKRLSHQEQLFSDYCPDHVNNRKFDVTLVMKFE